MGRLAGKALTQDAHVKGGHCGGVKVVAVGCYGKKEGAWDECFDPRPRARAPIVRNHLLHLQRSKLESNPTAAHDDLPAQTTHTCNLWSSSSQAKVVLFPKLASGMACI